MKNNLTFRSLHRYLGFFLAGIMTVYALSGVVLIFRETNTFRYEVKHELSVEKNLKDEKDLGKALEIRRFKIEKTEGNIIHFENGSYDASSGKAQFTTFEYPEVLKKLLKLHKADTDDPLYYLNIFFGISLLFFVISAFWMFMPGSDIFKKGMIFTACGIILTVILLFV